MREMKIGSNRSCTHLKKMNYNKMDYTIWYIWDRRNSEMHGVNKVPATVTASRIHALVEEFNTANAPAKPSPYVPKPRWRKPEPDVVKINFDGAYDKNSISKVRIGIIMMDFQLQ